MSGIVGILNRDGRLIDRALLHGLTNFLSFRGPDDQGVWAEGSVGLGHTMLRTTYEAAQEKQPAALDGRFFVTADVRLDQRADLIAALEQAGVDVPRGVCDPDLILRSYVAWGEDCVDRLRGDFSFAIWDAPERKLFCARDHFGVKPFYYANLKDAFVFSNTLDCLRAYPDVSDDLNDDAIADFLLFGLNCDVNTTTFRDIQRLPGAHTLTVSARGLQTRRYWMPPIDGRIRYKRPEEYVENFLALFRQAVADRLRTDRVAISMSGGLDSTSIAAVAHEIAANSPRPTELCAHTCVFDHLIRDDERHYAGEAAKFLKIPIEFFPQDDLPLFDRGGEPAARTPEPVQSPHVASAINSLKKLAVNFRVSFSGHAADEWMFFQMWPYSRDLLSRGEWLEFGRGMSQYLWLRPLPWRGIYSRLRKLVAKSEPDERYQWLSPRLSERARLGERRGRGPGLPRLSAAHPIFPVGYASMLSALWPRLFECDDPGFSQASIETRCPFLDLRVAYFLLAIPAFPWAFKKSLLRRAMAGRLPDTVLHRKKTPLRANPAVNTIQKDRAAVLHGVAWSGKISEFVNLREVDAAITKGRFLENSEVALRILGFNFWLRSDSIVRYNLALEAKYA